MRLRLLTGPGAVPPAEPLKPLQQIANPPGVPQEATARTDHADINGATLMENRGHGTDVEQNQRCCRMELEQVLAYS